MSAILFDNRLNEFGGAVDSITGQTITDARVAGVVLNALNAEAIVDLNGAAVVNMDVRTAAGNLTVVFEATVDGVNYFGLPAFDMATEIMTAAVVITTTNAKNYMITASGFRRIRARVSAYTSGTVSIALRASLADFAIYARPIPSTLLVTGTAAVNTGVTITLPAAGAGLFHYITDIELIKLYSVIGVAAGAGVIITSTNLPGGPSWTTEQLASAAGTVARVLERSFAGNPLKSLVANTATTIVMPAQLQTIWRGNVAYYIGA